MKILQLSSYFFPERVSSSHLTQDLYESFYYNGYVVENYVPTPTRGISKEERNKYRKIKNEKFCNGSIVVTRFYMFPEKHNPILRAIRYILINIIQYRRGIKAKNVDIIYASSTPPTQGFMCALVKRRLEKQYNKKVPLLFCLHDVFPDSMVESGLIKKGSFLWRIGSYIEKFIYENADTIVVISEDIKINIIEKGVPESKIKVIRNWIDTNEIFHIEKDENRLINELNLYGDYFNIVYAGNLGKAQDIDVILNAALILKDIKDIRFLIFGNGTEEIRLRQRIEKENLCNVYLFPLQPYSKVAEVYSLADVCIVSCKKGFGKTAFPSKTVTIMATGTPIIASFDKESELSRIIQEETIGLHCDPEDPEALSEKIIFLKRNKYISNIMGKNARKLAEKKFSKIQCVNNYISIIESYRKY